MTDIVIWADQIFVCTQGRCPSPQCRSWLLPSMKPFNVQCQPRTLYSGSSPSTFVPCSEFRKRAGNSVGTRRTTPGLAPAAVRSRSAVDARRAPQRVPAKYIDVVNLDVSLPDNGWEPIPGSLVLDPPNEKEPTRLAEVSTSGDVDGCVPPFRSINSDTQSRPTSVRRV
jgi:hypothetical protein